MLKSCGVQQHVFSYFKASLSSRDQKPPCLTKNGNSRIFFSLLVSMPKIFVCLWLWYDNVFFLLMIQLPAHQMLMIPALAQSTQGGKEQTSGRFILMMHCKESCWYLGGNWVLDFALRTDVFDLMSLCCQSGDFINNSYTRRKCAAMTECFNA